jgi:hypothetical protein
VLVGPGVMCFRLDVISVGPVVIVVGPGVICVGSGMIVVGCSQFDVCWPRCDF